MNTFTQINTGSVPSRNAFQKRKDCIWKELENISKKAELERAKQIENGKNFPSFSKDLCELYLCIMTNFTLYRQLTLYNFSEHQEMLINILECLERNVEYIVFRFAKILEN